MMFLHISNFRKKTVECERDWGKSKCVGYLYQEVVRKHQSNVNFLDGTSSSTCANRG